MEIKSYITALSLFSLIGALISYLIPQGSSKRSFRFISSVVFVYIIISPLINSDMHDLTFDFSSDRNEYNDSFKAKADKSIEITFENALRIKTKIVTVLIPPAVPMGEPPTNINSILTKELLFVKFSCGIVIKPAVLHVTD